MASEYTRSHRASCALDLKWSCHISLTELTHTQFVVVALTDDCLIMDVCGGHYIPNQ